MKCGLDAFTAIGCKNSRGLKDVKDEMGVNQVGWLLD